MEKFKKWSVLIDLDQNNERFLSQVAHLADRLVPQSISFIGIEQKEELPKDLLSDLPDLIEMSSKEKVKSLDQLIASKFHQEHHLKIEHVGNRKIGQVLRRINENQSDLLIIPSSNDGIDNFQQRVTRKTGASVLLLHASDKMEWSKISVAIDMSIYSDLCINLANELSSSNQKDVQVNILHAYQDSSRYLNQVFETVDEVQNALSQTSIVNKKLEDYARTKVNDYLTSNVKGLYYSHMLQHGRDKRPSQMILNCTRNMQTELLLIGSKGTGKSLASLMGNTADELVKSEQQGSMLVVKQKGENQGFLSSFLS